MCGSLCPQNSSSGGDCSQRGAFFLHVEHEVAIYKIHFNEIPMPLPQKRCRNKKAAIQT